MYAQIQLICSQTEDCNYNYLILCHSLLSSIFFPQSSFLNLPSSFFPILPTSLSFSQHSARYTRLRNFTLQPLPLPPKQRTFNSRKDDEARQEKLCPQAHSLSHEKTQRHHQSCDLSPNAGIPGCHGDAFVVYGRGGGEGKSSEDSDWETGRGKKILHVRTGMMSSQYKVPVHVPSSQGWASRCP